MSRTSEADQRDCRLSREHLCSHDLQLDNSEWPDSNTFSQLSSVSSEDDVTELHMRARVPISSLQFHAGQHNLQHTSQRLHITSSSRSNSRSRSEKDTASTSEIDVDCAESLTAETQYVQQGADPFGPCVPANRCAIFIPGLCFTAKEGSCKAFSALQFHCPPALQLCK